MRIGRVFLYVGIPAPWTFAIVGVVNRNVGSAGMTDMRHFNECACVIVTYDPDSGILSSQLDALTSQVATIVMVDNGSKPDIQEYLHRAESERIGVKLISLGSNYGIAHAQNVGIRETIAQGKRYVLLLDHDSIPAENVIQRLYATAETLRRRNVKLGALGVRLIEPRTGKENGFYLLKAGTWRRIRCNRESDEIVECDYLNSSGTFLPVETIEEAGYFDELLFIDHVDTDWCMRAKSKGFRFFGVCSTEIHHYMGESIARFWCFGWRAMPRRTPRRHYFIVRNSLWLYRRSYVPFFWKLNNFLKLIFTLIYFSLFDRERLLQARMIMRGFIDGAAGPSRARK